ncbi:MAG: hypothetical protein J5701_08915 [Bacteroidales bacterium]|nr:hypothetical protein [Bacteroidales bacterium]
MTEQTEKDVKKYKRLCIILAIVSIALAILSIYSLTHVREYVVTAEQAVNAQDDLQAELDSILREYEAIKSEYGSLNEQLTAKDSAILAQADEIQKLIASQGDYRRIKKKLELLQDQGKEYVNLLDSLYRQNEQLTNENIGLNQEISQLHEEREGLISEKEQLENKVNVAARLKAYNVSLSGYNSKNQITNKARRVKTLRASFTISENQLVAAGEKNIYARISLPDGRVLAIGTGDAYSFINEGKRLQYTIKEVINYENKAKTINLSWDLREGDAAVAGQYHVQLFTDENFMGEASLNLE